MLGNALRLGMHYAWECLLSLLEHPPFFIFFSNYAHM